MRVLASLLLLTLVTACQDGPDSDLLSYVEGLKSSQQGQLDPLPELKKRETFSYRADSEGIRDPFSTTGSFVTSESRESSVRPDNDRKRQVLEQFPLDTLFMVGSMKMSGEMVALVRSGDGIIHQVRVGDYVGQNYGKVVAVSSNEITLRELVPDGIGGWQERPATITLAK
ncbi:MAG: pilus assembly protein PilP [Gammaproteobacteria bacterium]|nr:pilus assembly protein PilP [Gammaproteobacteria bacterium]